VFERKILRKIFGPTKEDYGNWRIKTNIELDELIKHRNIINYVKAQRLSWFGHIHRMPETSIVKKIHKWKPFTRRPLGRPKCRWEIDVGNDLKKMKLIKWAEQAQDRHKWKDIVGRPRHYQSCSATEEEEAHVIDRLLYVQSVQHCMTGNIRNR
jgi:hypothetical protein